MWMRGSRRLVAALGFALAAAGAHGAPALVVSSIRPLHLIVLELAGGEIDARVLLDAGASPHDFALRPSQMRLLAAAQQVFWFGPELERPLVTVFERLPPPRRDTPLLAPLALQPRTDGGVDPHVWLDPQLAMRVAEEMARVLEQRGLASAAEMGPRLAQFRAGMQRTEGLMATELRGLEQVPFVAMHDGYAWFVKRFGLRQAAVLALDAEQQVGARTLAEMRATVRESGAVCLLRENSGSNARLAQMIAEGSGMRVAELDSLATSAPADANGYSQFLAGFARTVAACLRGQAS